MYRPSVQAVPGAKELLHRPVEPMARHAVRSVVSRLRSRSRLSAASAHAGRRRRRACLANRLRSSRRTAAASGSPAVPTTRPGD
ncbi:hypothetical protein [Amycolatopsis sp. lyj-112]|uniref:hypothetical protein n=1 Tax=Amycolatopsis sp. lyj-112 TaxID=2789288 RepID=UPI00397E8A7E